MVFKLAVGPMACNCYIIGCEITGEAVVVDPGADPDRIRAILRRNALTGKFVINTHGHGDHIGANAALGLPVLIHRLDSAFLTDPAKNLSSSFFLRILSPKASRLLEDDDKIECGRLLITVIHTHGHTPGGIALKTASAVFTGDTLFRGGVGRTDLPDGDEGALFKSIKEKLLVLDDDTIVYPGHGPDTTIGEERRNNPFL